MVYRQSLGKRRTAGLLCGTPSLTTAPVADSATTPLADCAPVAFTRYNGDNNPMPTPGPPTDEVQRHPKIKIAHPETAEPPRFEREGSLGTLESRRPSIR